MNTGIWWSQRNEILLMIGVPTPWYAQLLPMPAGCMECNGQNVDDPDSPLYGQTLPNLNDGRVLVGSLGDSGLEVGPAGAGLLLSRGHLPQVNLSADTGAASAGTPAGTLSVASASAGTPAGTLSIVSASAGTPSGTVANSTDGAHTHTADRTTSTPINASILALGTPVVERLVQTPTADSSAGAHTHNATFTGGTMAAHGHTGAFSGQALSAHGHTATFSGQALGDHQHSVSVPLNPDAQQSIDLTPKGITCRWIMRIK